MICTNGETLEQPKTRSHYSDVAVVIASLNEEEGIGPTIEELQRCLNYPRVLVVDGKSIDKTAEIAERLGAEVLSQEGKGKGDAIYQGINGINPQTTYIILTDADYTYPAEFVPNMLKLMDENERIGMVIGNRFRGEKNSQKSIINPFYLGNKFLAFAQNVVNGIDLEDPLSGLRIVRKYFLDDWKPKSKGFDIEAEMNYIVERKGFKIVEIPINYRKRLGEKKLKVRDGFSIFKRIISESFNT